MFESITKFNEAIEGFDGKVSKLLAEATAKESQALGLQDTKLTAILEGSGTDVLAIDKSVRQLNEEVLSLRQAAKSLEARKADYLESFIPPIIDEVNAENANLSAIADSKEALVLAARAAYLEALQALGSVKVQMQGNRGLASDANCKVGALKKEDRWNKTRTTNREGARLYHYHDTMNANTIFGVLGVTQVEVEKAFKGVS